MNHNQIKNLPLPVDGADAANKTYVVDSVAAGMHPSGSCQVATVVALPANTFTAHVITASANGALPAIDGQSDVVVGSRLLNRFPLAQPSNGIYVVTDLGSAATPWVLTRATDANTDSNIAGGIVLIIEGDTLAGKSYVCVTPAPFTVGTDNIEYSPFALPIVELNPDGGLEYNGGGELGVKVDVVGPNANTLVTTADGLAVDLSQPFDFVNNVSFEGDTLNLGDIASKSTVNISSNDLIALLLSANDSNDHLLSIGATNTGSGTANIVISADDDLTTSATNQYQTFATLNQTSPTQASALSGTITLTVESVQFPGSGASTVATYTAPAGTTTIFLVRAYVTGQDPANPSSESASFVATNSFISDGTSVSTYATSNTEVLGFVSGTPWWWATGATCDIVGSSGNTVNIVCKGKSTSSGTYQWRARVTVDILNSI
jgi:hypothetical protein